VSDLLRQEVVQYVSQNLQSGHSVQGIRIALSRSYPPEDVNEALEALGVHEPYDALSHNSHTLMVRVLLLLTILVIVAAVVGLLVFGAASLKAHAGNLPVVGTLPEKAPSNPSTALGRTPASISKSSSIFIATTGIPDQTTSQTPPTTTQDITKNPLPSTGIGRCSSFTDPNSQEAQECRATEAAKLSGPLACNDYQADDRVYETCSRAFYEQATAK